MGKTVKKNQTAKVTRSTFGGTYVVKGKKFSLHNATSDSIAENMADHGYRAGAVARWNGGSYKLNRDHFGDFSLERIA